MRQSIHHETEPERALSPSSPAELQRLPKIYESRPHAPTSSTADRNTSPTVRAILAVVLVILLAMLAYLMSLSSRPSVSALTPKPGSITAPGLVAIEAHVGAPKPIQQVTLSVDGIARTPAVTTLGDRSWVVRYETVLPKGTHKAVVTVRDTNGGQQTQTWSFQAAGPRITPTISFADPPSNATLPQGLLWIYATVHSDADITSATLTVNGQDLPVILKPADSAPTATNTDPTAQLWSVGAEHAFTAGSYTADVVAQDAQGDRSDARWRFTVTSDPAKATARYFSSTRLYVSGKFLNFWESNNGSILFGSPVSAEFTEENGRVVQYFENARLEMGQDGKVSLGLIGDESIATAQSRVARPQNFAGLYFDSTGHTLAGKFKDFWEANGGLQMFGYPISEVLDQNGTKVQYFERARFELAQNGGSSTVKLTPLGAQMWSSLQADGKS